MSENDKIWTAIDNIRVGFESIKNLFTETIGIEEEDEDLKVLVNVLNELEELI